MSDQPEKRSHTPKSNTRPVPMDCGGSGATSLLGACTVVPYAPAAHACFTRATAQRVE